MADTDKEQKEALNADKKAQQDQEKVQKQEASKKVVTACSIDLDDIFVLLHVKAASEVKECKILNSAIEGDGKNAKFHGAGSHIIAAVPLKGDEITLQDAFIGIKQYVTAFNGPDVANKLKETDLILLEDENTDNAKPKGESTIPYIPSFMTYLTEEGKENNKDDIELRKDKLSKKSNQEIDRRKEERNPKDTTAKGFYITYKIAIEGQKESPLSDALKSFGAGLLKGLGIQGFSWKTGAKGKEHTIGDLLDTLDKVFGKIDPNELKTRFAKNMQTKYPLTRATDVQYYDKKTLIKYLGEKLDAKLKQKINSADYSLCYKVEANDKTKKFINVTVVADAITRSIKGLFKKFKNKVDAKDVILVNDYAETDKDLKKIEKKLEVKKDDTPKADVSTESINVFKDVMSKYTALVEKTNNLLLVDYGKLIFESDNHLNSILEAEDKKELINKVLAAIEKDDSLVKKIQDYDGDLTGNTTENKLTFKTTDGKEHPLTNDVVKARFKNPKFQIKHCKVPTLNRILEVIEELKTAKPKENENLDILDSISTNYDYIKDTINNVENKDVVLKDYNKSKEYKGLITTLKSIPKLNSKFANKDEFMQSLTDVDNRKLLLQIDTAFETAKDGLDSIIEKNEKTTATNKENADKTTIIELIIKLIEDNEDPNKKYLTDDNFDKDDYVEELNKKSIKDVNKIKAKLELKIADKKQELKKLLNGKLDDEELTDELLNKTSVKELISNVSKVDLKVKHTDIDFYIVPMKGLKMDNTDDDDEKEAEGKGK